MAENKSNVCESCKCHVPITLRDLFWQDPFFSTNWDDFDTLRDQMFQETKSLWSKFDNRIKRLESREEATGSGNDIVKHEGDFLGSFGFPRRFLRLPSIFNEEKTKDFLSSSDDQIIQVKDDDKAFEVSLDTHHYRPDEIKVSVVNNILGVEGKHEEKSDDGSKYVSRQFVRKYTLPMECPPEKVNSNLSADGVLLITAPKRAEAIQHDRNVPIKMDKK